MFQSIVKKFWVNNLEKLGSYNKHVASLDPLNIDLRIKKLTLLNEQRAVGEIIKELYSVIPFPDQLNQFDEAEALACMRDLGIYLGSIRRHGLEPVEEVPELDYILDILSSKTDMPPRDTLFHYTQWNPEGERLRTYTHFRDEINLIKSVQVAMMPLMYGVYGLMELYNVSFYDPLFSVLCNQIRVQFNAVIQGIVIAKRNVSPELFAKELRLYFDPIVIYNRSLIGPGAVEMPLFVFDYILWGSDVENKNYQEFSRTYLPFNISSVRDIYYNFIGKPSLVTRMTEALKDNPNDAVLMDNARALQNLCKLEKSFRIPHKRLAEESYQHQPKATRDVGSGGYSTSILGEVLEENLKQINKLGQAILFTRLA